MSERLCHCCETEITAARIAALPGATLCTVCQKVQGDVPLTKGVMVYEHKTAPTIVIGADAEKLLPYQRRGFHAQLPLNGKNNPRMISSLNTQNLSVAIRPTIPQEDQNVEPASMNGSRCHPSEPRVNARGDCAACALAWYERRKK